MPWSACQGLPDGPCPKQRCDRTVVLGIGDLMLCKECDIERRQQEVKKIKEKSTTPTISTNPEGSKPISQQNKLVVNELMTYIKHYRSKCQAENLKRIILTSFSNGSITETKKLLIKLFNNVVNKSQFVADRRNSTTRSASEADLDDIIGLLDIIEQNKADDKILFVAVNLDSIPKAAPDDLTLRTIAEKQNQIEVAVDEISIFTQQSHNNINTNVSTQLNQMQQKIVDLSSTLHDYMSDINKSNNQHSPVADRITTIRDSTEVKSSTSNRLANLIVYGIPENRDVVEWRRTVDEVLSFLLNKPVDLVDSFRLGRYVENKTRPILIKLTTMWDRRLVLTKCSQLKHNLAYKRIYIAADEPLDERRKHSLERLRKLAERNGHQTEMNENDNVLYVNGIAFFSIANGLIGDKKLISDTNTQNDKIVSSNHSPPLPSSD